MRNESTRFKAAAHLFLSIIFFSAQLPVSAQDEPLTDQQLETEYERALERARGRLTLGTRIGESSEGYLDILQPIFGGENGLLFLNPKLSASDRDEEELSIGLGTRLLLPDLNVILGANVFYDERRTKNDNSFDQVGAGVEILTEWVDARANYYWPEDKQRKIDSTSETSVDSQSSSSLSDIYAAQHQLLQNQFSRTTTTTTTREFNRYEAPLEGYDAEIGLRLPYLPAWLETRLFAGYYKFDGDYTDDIKGVRGRLEVRALPALFIDAEVYENKDLTGSDYFVGARLNVPFDLVNLARGRNPFEGFQDNFKAGRREFRERMSEMVMRDPHVRIHESGFIEDESLRQVKSETRSSSETLVVLDDVSFVNNSNGGAEDGTAENPFNTVQEGVNGAFGLKNVYVFPGAGPYNENVVISENGIQLLGSGKGIAGFGGKVFGGVVHPVLNGNVGGVDGPVIHVTANDVLIQGFNINRAPGGLSPGVFDGLGFGNVVDRVGVLGENANNLTVFCNLVNNQQIGVMLLTDGLPDYLATIDDNTFSDMSDLAVYAIFKGPGDAELTLRDNVVRNANDGFELYFDQLNNAYLNLVGNRVESPLDIGVEAVFGNIVNDAGVFMSDNIFSGSGSVGAYLEFGQVGGNVDVSTENDQFINNTDLGLYLTAQNIGGDLSIFADGIQVNGNGSGGALFLGVNVTGNVDVAILDSQFDGNSGGPGLNMMFVPVEGDINIFVDPTTASHNDGPGLNLLLVGNQDIFVELDQVTADNNGGGGIVLSAFAPSGSVQALLTDVVASSNLGFGINALLHAQEDVLFGIDEFFSASGNSITANDNTGNGMIFVFLSDSGMVAMASHLLEANNNSGDGILMSVIGQSLALNTINRLDANNNMGSGAIVFMSSVDGNSFFDLGSAELTNNAGTGLQLGLDSRDTSAALLGQDIPLFVLLPDRVADGIVANDNGGIGFNFSLGSTSGSVIALGASLEAQRNQSGGMVANVFAYEDIDFVLGAKLEGTNLLTSNVMFDNNNGPGLVFAGSAETGYATLSVVNGTMNSNQAGGLSANMVSAEDATLLLGAGFIEDISSSFATGSFDANDNNGSGITASLFSTGSSSRLFFTGGGASRNTGDGFAAFVNSHESSQVLLGEFLFGLEGGVMRFNENNGAGVNMSVNSMASSVTLITSALEANHNGGAGVFGSLTASSGVTVVMGISQSGTNISSALVQANQNSGAGILLTALTQDDDTSILMPWVEASQNLAGGINIFANSAMGDTDINVGTLTSIPISSGTLSVEANDNLGVGVTIVAGSTTGFTDVRVGSGSASGNAGGGLFISATSFDDVDVTLGKIFNYLSPDPLFRANDNTGHGINIVAVSSVGEAELITGGLEANGNSGFGISAVLVGDTDAKATMGIEILDFVTNVITAPIVANNNQGGGMHVTLLASAEANMTMGDFTATNNLGSGISVLANADGNVNVDLGVLTFASGLINVPGSGLVSGNVGNGLLVNAISTFGSSTVLVNNVTASGNGVNGVLVNSLASMNNSAVTISQVVANNNSDSGVLVNSDGLASFVFFDHVTAMSNSLYGMYAISAGGSASGSVEAVGINASYNLSTGAVFLARGGDNARVYVTNSIANGNAHHGILGAVDHTTTGRAEIVNITVNDNGRYGVVALAVASNAASASTSQIIGSGNAEGNGFINASSVATNWFDIQP